MTIPVLLEPIPTGFRASTGAPLNLTAEAPTADEALAAIRRAYIEKQVTGAQVVALELPEPDPLIAAARRFAAEMAANPLFDEWVAAMKEYRREREAEEDAAEAAAEAARTKSAPQQEPAA